MNTIILLQLYEKNKGNLSEIAREMGVSRQAVHQHIKKLGLKGAGKKTKKIKVKKEHGNVKYSTELLHDLLIKHRGDISLVAKDIGTFYSCLFRLLKNRNINYKDYHHIACVII